MPALVVALAWCAGIAAAAVVLRSRPLAGAIALALVLPLLGLALVARPAILALALAPALLGTCRAEVLVPPSLVLAMAM